MEAYARGLNQDYTDYAITRRERNSNPIIHNRGVQAENASYSKPYISEAK